MKGQNELPLGNFKTFSREHGKKKKSMKISWSEYITKFQRGEIKP